MTDTHVWARENTHSGKDWDPNLTVDMYGMLYWKYREIDHQLPKGTSERRLEIVTEIAARCRHLENISVPINADTVIWYWNWFKDMTLDHPYRNFLSEPSNLYGHGKFIDIDQWVERQCIIWLRKDGAYIWNGASAEKFFPPKPAGPSWTKCLASWGFLLWKHTKSNTTTGSLSLQEITQYLELIGFPRGIDPTTAAREAEAETTQQQQNAATMVQPAKSEGPSLSDLSARLERLETAVLQLTKDKQDTLAYRHLKETVTERIHVGAETGQVMNSTVAVATLTTSATSEEKVAAESSKQSLEDVGQKARGKLLLANKGYVGFYFWIKVDSSPFIKPTSIRFNCNGGSATGEKEDIEAAIHILESMDLSTVLEAERSCYYYDLTHDMVRKPS